MVIEVIAQVLYVGFCFNDTATTEIYTLSLHDALPICLGGLGRLLGVWVRRRDREVAKDEPEPLATRSEEHTSELQSPVHLVCRLLLEKKKATPQRLIQTVPPRSPPLARTSKRSA